MIDDKTLKSLPKREMVMCEVTGKLYPAEECEVVIVKIVKAKTADINDYHMFKRGPEPVFNGAKQTVTEVAVAQPTVIPAQPTEAQIREYKRSLIPRGILDTMNKPPELLDGM